MELSQAIAEFDGVRVAPLREYVADFLAQDCAALEDLCFGPDAAAATWIIKALLEKDRAGGIDMVRVFSALDGVIGWEARLHLLQIVQFAADAALGQRPAIRACFDDKKILVRVWALDAFVRLALVDGVHLEEARELVKEGLVAKAGSIRSRAGALERLVFFI